MGRLEYHRVRFSNGGKWKFLALRQVPEANAGFHGQGQEAAIRADSAAAVPRCRPGRRGAHQGVRSTGKDYFPDPQLGMSVCRSKETVVRAEAKGGCRRMGIEK